MRFEVMLGSFLGMVRGMQVVSVRNVGIMRRLCVVPALMVPRGFFVMSGRMLMMLCSFQMMFCAILAHKEGIGCVSCLGFS
jgi:hypothetical protein